jgi:uncharacterized protein (DUF433 family)
MPQIMDAQKLLERITVNSQIFNGKPIIRGRRLAVEHIIHISKSPARVTRKE